MKDTGPGSIRFGRARAVGLVRDALASMADVEGQRAQAQAWLREHTP